MLGAQNNIHGQLSAMALGRVKKALEVFNINKGYKLILTGDKGWNFNRTNKSHFTYSSQFLTDNGISKDDIFSTIPSRNTVEDIILTKVVLERNQIRKIKIITSDFHMQRVKLICNRIFGKKYFIEFIKVDAKIGFFTRFIHSVHEFLRIIQILLLNLHR